MLFTFHYVTINSSPTRANLLSHLNLHPTM